MASRWRRARRSRRTLAAMTP
ncbi:DUF1127 domain-containing protein [Planctomycetes bacterium Poly30]